MAFHRLTNPTYFGGLPVGYDFINDPAANGDPGSPAVVSTGTKNSGVNEGTYFIAFGEDGTSGNGNRAHYALAQNTDLLDDLMHRDLALPTRTADVLAGAPVTSVVIAGEVFVGIFGTANTQENRDLLVQVLDSNDREIIDSNGNTVVPTLIHDGALVSVVGTEASGFRTGPQVEFNPPIPTGTTYRVYYGRRSNLAEMSTDALTNIRIRGAEEVDGTVEKQLRNLHAEGAIQAWDAAWDSTIRALAASGLNERYRRQTATPSSFNFDTPGDGAVIQRTGVSPRSQSRFGNNPSGFASIARDFDNHPDPYNAMWIAEMMEGSQIGDATKSVGVGSNGFVAITTRWAQRGEDRGVPGTTAYLTLWEHERVTTAAPTDGYYTHVESGAAATLEEDTTVFGNASGEGVYKVTLTGTQPITGVPYFFWRSDSGVKRTAITLKRDILRINVPGVGTFAGTIVYLDPADENVALVRFMDGGDALTGLPTGVSSVAVTVSWLSVLYHQGIGGAVQRALWDPGSGSLDSEQQRATPTYEGLFLVEPPALGEDPSVSWDQYRLRHRLQYAGGAGATLPFDSLPLAYLGAGLSLDDTLTKCLSWGYFENNIEDTLPNGERTGWRDNGVLWNDGSIHARGRSKFNLSGYFTGGSATPGNGASAFDWNPAVDGGWLDITFTGTGTEQLTLTLNAAYFDSNNLDRGDELIITVRQAATGTGTGTIVAWPANFRFSSVGDQTPTQGTSAVTLYRIFKGVGSSDFLVTKFSFP